MNNKIKTTRVALTILVCTFIQIFSSCDREKAPAQPDELDFAQPIAVEEVVAPEYVPIPRPVAPGETPRALSPILQEFGQDNDISIAIITPEWVSRYGKHVIVRGRALGGTAGIASLRWEILDTEHRAEISSDPNGYFEFAIPTLGLPTVFFLRIVAADSRGGSEERLFGLITERRAPTTTPAVAVPSPPVSPSETVEQVAAAEIAEAVEETPIRIPVLTLNRPADKDYFSGELTINGTLSDSAGQAFPAEEIESVSWEAEGSGFEGNLEVDEQGRFATIVDAAAVRQDTLLILRAVAANGRVAKCSVHLRADISAPLLQIHSPQEGEAYEEVVVVQGAVVDRGPVSLRWKILGVSEFSGQLSLSEEGGFHFEIPTRGLEGIQIFELRAIDQLGNATVSTVTLKGRQQPARDTESAAPTIRDSQPPPQLIIESPQNRSYYHSLVVVKGVVVEGNSLSWEIPGSGLKGSGIVGTDGRFSLTIPAAELQGTQMLRLSTRADSGEQVDKAIVLLDHEKGPEITIATPENRSYYRGEIRLEGLVGNPEDDWDSVGEVAGLSLQVDGFQDTPVDIPFEADGRFSLIIPATDLSGKKTMILTAEDRNGDLNQEVLTLRDGNLNPSVSITSPQIDQLYGSKVRVSGVVIDPYADGTTLGGIESVTYDVTSPKVFALAKSVPMGEVELGEDSSFDFVVSTRELAGPQDINIVVRARNGNQTKTSVRILEGEADIPVFSVEAGDRRALLLWDPLPSATRYTLSYRTANPGQRPGRETRIDRVRSPYALAGLANGNRYVFQLEAVLPGEPDSESAQRWAIPLSAETLRPTTAGEFEQIRISWPSIPGCEQYALWRSASREGEYALIAAALADTHYLDTDVQYGRSYLYKVSPAPIPEFTSNPVPGESTAFPVEKLETAGLCRLNQAGGITLHGGYAFVAGGSEGVKIVDISVPEDPTLVGGIQTAEARDIAIQGEYAFVADGERGLKVLDISDPRVPLEIGMRKTMDARAIALEGATAYIADGSSGVKIIDVSSPLQPIRIGSYATDNACDIVVHEGKLYLADGKGGLRIFELSDTTELVQTGHLPEVDVRSLAVDGTLLYLAAAAGGLIIIDISDPEELVELGSFAANEVLDVSVSGTFAYLADSRAQMIVVDVSDPARPWQFASFPAQETSSISVRGHYAYLATAPGLEVVHILIQGRSVPIAGAATGGKAYDLRVSGPRAYAACHDLGIRIIDISDPAGLSDESVIGAWSGDYSVGIEVADSTAFVANGRRGLSILDLSPAWDDDALTQPKRIGSYHTGGTAHRTVVRSDLLFVADGQEGLKILDVSAASNPVEIGSVSSADARDVVVIPDYALIADGQNGLIICDIKDPSSPIPITTLDRQGVHRIVVQDALVAVAGPNGVDMYDFSDPQRPELLGRFESEYVESIFIHGLYLYIAEGYRGLTVLDIQSFDRPVAVSACAGIYAVDVAVYGGYALVADSRQIHVVEVLIPEWLRRSSSRR